MRSPRAEPGGGILARYPMSSGMVLVLALLYGARPAQRAAAARAARLIDWAGPPRGGTCVGVRRGGTLRYAARAATTRVMLFADIHERASAEVEDHPDFLSRRSFTGARNGAARLQQHFSSTAGAQVATTLLSADGSGSGSHGANLIDAVDLPSRAEVVRIVWSVDNQFFLSLQPAAAITTAITAAGQATGNKH